MAAWITVETVLGSLCAAGGLAASVWMNDPPGISLPLWLAVDAVGAALLGIGLVRDLWLIVKARRAGRSARPERKSADKPICLESLLGALLVAVGLVCLATGVQRPMTPSLPVLVTGAGLVFIVSGLIKDVVLVFRIEKDHGNVILW